MGCLAVRHRPESQAHAATFPGARLQGKRQGDYSQMDADLALGHVHVEMVLVRAVGLRPQDCAEDAARGAMRGPRRNWALPVKGSAAGAGLAASPCVWARPGGWAASIQAPWAHQVAGIWTDMPGTSMAMLGRSGLLGGDRQQAVSGAGWNRHSSAWPQQRRLRLPAASGPRQPAPRSRGPSDPNRPPPWSFALGGDERADVERIDPAVLAQAAVLAAVGVAAGVGAHGCDADDGGAQMLARQGLHVALQPFVQGGDHVAGEGGRRREGDLRVAADADQLHGRRRAAFRAFANGVSGTATTSRPLSRAVQRACASSISCLRPVGWCMARRRPCLAADLGQTARILQPAAATERPRPAAALLRQCCRDVANTQNTAAVAQPPTCISEMPLLPAPEVPALRPTRIGSRKY